MTLRGFAAPKNRAKTMNGHQCVVQLLSRMGSNGTVSNDEEAHAVDAQAATALDGMFSDDDTSEEESERDSSECG